MNNIPPADDDDLRRLMSALTDGEADAAEVARGCVAWAAADEAARHSWYAYQLIGDVLRSEDLAAKPARDLAFLDRLRLSLDAEPAVLAPQPLPGAADRPAVRRRAWVVPAALAAGVMALASVLVVAIGPGAGPSGPVMALAPTPTVVPAAASAAVETPALAEAAPPGGAIVRSAQLDRYLRAHRDYGNGLPGSLPGGSGRSVTTVSFER